MEKKNNLDEIIYLDLYKDIKKIIIFSLNILKEKGFDKNRNFINLVYRFREKVIHTEGLSQIIHPIVIGWSNFIQISQEIKNFIDQCGDEKSEYKIITEWGITIDRFDNQKLYLDPYFFSIKLLATTLKFTDQYLKSLGLPLSNTSNMLKDFRQDNLRDYF